MRPTVLLFDIDGTLVTTGGAGRRAIERAFEHLHSHRNACTFPLDGMTDRAIVRAGLKAIGLQPVDALIDQVLVGYVQILEEEVAKVDAAEYRLHIGIASALDAARARPEIAIGLGTGNIKEGARVKLTRVGIYERFSFGGFGCDHEDRAEILRQGANRGAERLGLPLGKCRVVAIGDTPKDVIAAKDSGFECVGVGTGRYSARELIESGATAAFSNLADQGAVQAILGF